jgi:transcriptional regulator with XRE-family HTH domain
MSTKPLKTRLREAVDRRKISFLELERQTGIKANRMYKWYQQGTNPKKEDADILEKWLNDLDKATNGHSENITLSKEPLEKAILHLSEGRLIDARSIERLITLLEKKLEKEIGYNFPDEVSEDLEGKKTGTKAGT